MIELTDGGRANIFVAAMGASEYCFALATPGQMAADWLGATAAALNFYGGVPKLILPDTPRALVSQAAAGDAMVDFQMPDDRFNG